MAIARELMDDHDHSLDNPTDDDYAALLERIENLTRAATEGEAAKREIADLERRLAAMTENLRRLQSRKSVRLALALAARTRFVRVPRTVRDPRWVRRLKDWRSRLRVRSARKSKSRVAGPAVTVVIPTHNGARQLHSCLRGLSRRTSYRDFAVIVVHNASTDDTDAIVRASQLDISTIRNTSNRTFSEACNQGLAAAHTPYVLFLNNDVSPINAGWLGAMVTALEEDPSAAAAGALLTFPITSRSGVRDPLASTIQHAGVAFGWHQGAPRGIHVRRGEDPTTSDLLETRTVPAATAACMLVEVAATRSISGFDEGFIYGWEDVDLCLRLNQAGHRTIFVGSAALEHHESSTQKAAGKAMRDANLRINSRRFWDWWSPTLSPLILEDQIAGLWILVDDQSENCSHRRDLRGIIRRIRRLIHRPGAGRCTPRMMGGRSNCSPKPMTVGTERLLMSVGWSPSCRNMTREKRLPGRSRWGGSGIGWNAGSGMSVSTLSTSWRSLLRRSQTISPV